MAPKIGSPDRDTSWIPWTGSVSPEVDDERPWLARTRLYAFRLLVALATIGLLVMVARAAILQGEVTWPDAANAAFFILLFALSFTRPNWLRSLTWLGLASLFLNAIDGLDFHGTEVIVPVHILLPLFILYAALLGDLYMSLTAMIGVLGIYAATWSLHGDLSDLETLTLTNLILLTILSGTAALGVWFRHSRLEKTLDLQARALRTELETRLRVQAMVAHDVRTPLTVLMNASEVDDNETVQEMAARIDRIVDAAQSITQGSGMSPSAVTIEEVWIYTTETFAAKLADKEQTLSLGGDPELVVEADLPTLCNSVIGNFLSNAIKFSPRGSALEMVAEAVGDSVRIAVFDEGPGLPKEMLLEGPGKLRHHSTAGTEGEVGTGYGLHIAALCAARMGGHIEITGESRGAAVSVVLPRTYTPEAERDALEGANSGPSDIAETSPLP